MICIELEEKATGLYLGERMDRNAFFLSSVQRLVRRGHAMKLSLD